MFVGNVLLQFRLQISVHFSSTFQFLVYSSANHQWIMRHHSLLQKTRNDLSIISYRLQNLHRLVLQRNRKKQNQRLCPTLSPTQRKRNQNRRKQNCQKATSKPRKCRRIICVYGCLRSTPHCEGFRSFECWARGCINFGGDYAQLLHRINAHLTDAMIVESGNAKLNILYGVNRNFGITGINEAGQICINGPMLSEFDPRPTVNSILAGQYKPRKKCNISKWKQQPYNIGIFAESNDHNNKRRSQYRKSIETVLIPGKDTTQKVKIESVKSVIKQRDRKKAEAHARAKAKAEATKAAAEAARAKEEDAKADDDEDVKAADESIESSDSGSSDDDIPIDAPKRKLKYASSSESESSSSYESESD
eukprot:612207_1